MKTIHDLLHLKAMIAKLRQMQRITTSDQEQEAIQDTLAQAYDRAAHLLYCVGVDMNTKGTLRDLKADAARTFQQCACRLHLDRGCLLIGAETSGGSALMTSQDTRSSLVGQCNTPCQGSTAPYGTRSPTVQYADVLPRQQQTGMLDERRSVAHALAPALLYGNPNPYEQGERNATRIFRR